MQKKTLILLAASTAVLALTSVLLLAVLVRSRGVRREQVAALRTEAQARAEDEERTRGLEQDRTRLARQNDELAALATSLRASQARQGSNAQALATQLSNLTDQAQARPGEPVGNGQEFRAMMEKMTKDPAMREMMRNMQKPVMSQLYGPLFKDLGLTGDQKQQFMDILLDNAMKGIGQAGAFLQAGGTEKSDALKALTEQQKDMNTALQSLLGPDKYAQYEEYQKTIGERTQLSQFRQQLGGTDSPLQEEQATQLLQILREEKARVPSVLGDGAGRSAEALKALASEDMLQRQLQWQEDMNRRVLGRAGQVLAPDQLKEYESFLGQQLDMQKVGFKMAREMFGAGKNGAGASPEVPVQVIPTPAK